MVLDGAGAGDADGRAAPAARSVKPGAGAGPCARFDDDGVCFVEGLRFGLTKMSKPILKVSPRDPLPELLELPYKLRTTRLADGPSVLVQLLGPCGLWSLCNMLRLCSLLYKLRTRLLRLFFSHVVVC